MTEVTGLDGYEPEESVIKLKGKGGKDYSFKVRGLTIPDVTKLLEHRLGDVEAAYELVKGDKRRLGADDIIISLLGEAPALMAEVISAAADDRGNPEVYLKLPFSAQHRALAEIARMTLEEAGGLKNLFATLQSLLPAAFPDAAAASRAKAEAEASGISIGDFEKT